MLTPIHVLRDSYANIFCFADTFAGPVCSREGFVCVNNAELLS